MLDDKNRNHYKYFSQEEPYKEAWKCCKIENQEDPCLISMNLEVEQSQEDISDYFSYLWQQLGNSLETSESHWQKLTPTIC